MADIEKLNLIIAKIEQHPEAHRQAVWGVRYGSGYLQSRLEHGGAVPACGTAFCVAGWAGVVDGANMEWSHDDPVISADLITIDGTDPDIYAARALQLTDTQARVLFGGNNSLDDIKAMRDVLAENPGAGYDELQEARYRWLYLRSDSNESSFSADDRPSETTTEGNQEI